MKRKFGSQSLKWQGGILEEDSDKPIQIKSTESHTPKTSQHSEAKKISGRCALRIEKKGRGGSPVVILFKFSDPEAQNTASLKKLCSDLKTKLACGGTIDNGEIILTLQDIEKVKSVLSKLNIH